MLARTTRGTLVGVGGSLNHSGRQGCIHTARLCLVDVAGLESLT